MRRVLIGAVVWLTAWQAGAAMAQDPPATPLSGVDVVVHSKATPLSGVDVALPRACLGPRKEVDSKVPRPRLIGTFPAEGATVRPGLIVLRFTFDLPMSCDGVFLKVQSLPKPCQLDQAQHLVLSYDRRTIRMACLLTAGVRYGLRMGESASPTDALPKDAQINHVAFKSVAGQTPEPVQLTFTTSSDQEVATLEEAEAEDAGYPIKAATN